MAVFNNGFPVSYQPIGFQPYQAFPQQAPQMQAGNGQVMTPPTIRAEIVQVDSEQAAAAFPVGTGASQMMIAKDDSAIFIKTANANGYVLDVYEKRPPAPPAPAFDPGEFVRKDELEALLAKALAPKKVTDK
jgi:hypothetical protein